VSSESHFPASDLPIAALAHFCIENFKHMKCCSSMHSCALLSRGVANTTFLLCSNDLQSVRVYLRFVQLTLTASEGFLVKVDFSFVVVRLAFEVIRKLDIRFVHCAFRQFGRPGCIPSCVWADGGKRWSCGSTETPDWEVCHSATQCNSVVCSASARVRRVDDEWEDLSVDE
jgi:hypothetical protein